MAAYKHVKETGNKVKDHRTVTKGGSAIGLISSDGTLFMMWVEHFNANNDSNKKLAIQIVNNNISITDFINKQLLPFL